MDYTMPDQGDSLPLWKGAGGERVQRGASTPRTRGRKPTCSLSSSLLSNRELEVFEMFGHGMTVQRIARRLGLSPKTVESHRKQIKDKLSLKNGAELARCAITWVNGNEASGG